MSKSASAAYAELIRSTVDLSVLSSATAVLGWDERVNMPSGAVEGRAEQLSILARMEHELFTSPRVGDLLQQAEAGDDAKVALSDVAINLRWIRRSYERAKKLPVELVEELTKTASLGEAAWIEARKNSDFKSFEPWLAKQINLKQRQAECYGFSEHIYDALLDDYEPHATTAQVKQIFNAFRPGLVDVIRKVEESGKVAPIEILQRRYPIDAQYKFGLAAAQSIGFDTNHGRLDISVHPFCSGLGRGDVRITTRYDDHEFGDAFFGVLHETGHALYEQGNDTKHWGTPRGRAVSLGIHESQSRMWENFVGRSRSFWQFMLPQAKAAFPEALGDVGAEEFLFAVNAIRPSLIRVESDEATYNLHVMLRFDLEQQMLSGALAAKDVPAAWNDRMKADLGVTVPDDRQGCLQDTHWAAGLIGYFPTYALGNMYAAQFFETAGKELGDLDAQFARGEFAPLLDWLREKIHRKGMTYAPRDLVKSVTGRDLSHEPLLRYLKGKASEFYGVA